MSNQTRKRDRQDKDKATDREREDRDTEQTRSREDYDDSPMGRNVGNYERRSDDRRIEQIQGTLEKFWILFNGDGLDDPGIKGHIIATNKILRGDGDEVGLVGKSIDHEKRIRSIESIKIFGIALGAIIVGLAGWGDSIKGFLKRFLGF